MFNRFKLKRTGLIALALPTMALAGSNVHMQQPLDKVSLVFNAQRWVQTDTAVLQVTINATLTKSSLVEMRSQIMANLNKIAKGDWHITNFNRSQDSSGLEKLYVNAQARINQSLLTNVNANAKQISKPGVSYRINNIDFSPSDADVQQVKQQVRQDLYKKIQDELNVLNKQYEDQKYSVFRVYFTSPDTANQMYQNRQPYAKKMVNFVAEASAAPAVSVSNKVKLSAVVTLASNREVDK